MTLRLLALLLVPLSLIPAAPALAVAQQRTLTQREMFLVQSVVFQSSSKEAALTRRYDAALTARSNEIGRLIIQLRDKQAAERRANRALAASRADNDRLEAEIVRMAKSFNDELAAKDAEFAQDRAAMEADALDLMATPEGRRGMEAFASNEPGSVELANSIWDRLIDMRTARQFRQIATINATKLWQGQVTIASLISRWEKIPAADRVHMDWTALSGLYRMSGNREQSRMAAHKALETAASQRDKGVALNELGDLLASEDRSEAKRHYEESRVVREMLVAGSPENATWQHDLSVSYIGLGDLIKKEDRQAALRLYEKSLDIRKKLVASDPGNAAWQHELSVSFARIGDLIRVDNKEAARRFYEQSLAIEEKWAANDPANPVWQHGLSVSYDRLGDLLAPDDPAAARRRYEQSLAIAEKLAANDLSTAGWQRDLAISYERLGDLLVPDDRAAARRRYEQSIAIRKKLVGQDPKNSDWQEDLAISYLDLGHLLEPSEGVAARQLYEQSIAIRRMLAMDDPSNNRIQRGSRLVTLG